MTKQRIIEKVNAIMAAKAGIDAGDIKPDDFYDELGADSVQCIEVLMEIEKEFAIDIPGRYLICVSTMQQVYDVVEQVIGETMKQIDNFLKQKS